MTREVYLIDKQTRRFLAKGGDGAGCHLLFLGPKWLICATWRRCAWAICADTTARRGGNNLILFVIFLGVSFRHSVQASLLPRRGLIACRSWRRRKLEGRSDPNFIFNLTRGCLFLPQGRGRGMSHILKYLGRSDRQTIQPCHLPYHCRIFELCRHVSFLFQE